MKKLTLNTEGHKMVCADVTYNRYRKDYNIITTDKSFITYYYSPQIPEGFIYYPQTKAFYSKTNKVFIPQDAFVWTNTFLNHYAKTKDLIIVSYWNDNFDVVKAEGFNKDMLLAYLGENKEKFKTPVFIEKRVTLWDNTTDLYQFGMNPNTNMVIGSGRTLVEETLAEEFHHEKSSWDGYTYVVDALIIFCNSDTRQIIADLDGHIGNYQFGNRKLW